MDPSEVHEATEKFLTDHPGSEAAVVDLVALDEREQTWTFDRAGLDSGLFGELVSRKIVENVGDEYQIAHREAVRAALAGEQYESTETGSRIALPHISVPVDYTTVAGLLLALGVIVVSRAWKFTSVFRGEYVVSPSNDPYFYRYWQANLLDASAGLTDTSVITSLPTGARSRPYTHVMNWWITELVGGTEGAADLVAAWLPVVGAVALGVVVFATVVTLTDDTRIGLLAVILLGLMPVHAVYTALGFLEHRLHQYFWLGVMVFALTWLATDLDNRLEEREDSGAIIDHLTAWTTWGVAAILAISVVITPYPWAGSALIFVPLAAYLFIRVATEVRHDVNPVLANLPILVATLVGGLVALYPHLQWGWHEGTGFLAYTPGLVAIGGIAVASLGELWRRLGRRSSVLIGLETAVGAGLVVVFTQIRPDQIGQIRSRGNALLFREAATETSSLFSELIVGPLIQLGFSFYLAIAALIIVTWAITDRYQPQWLLHVVFAWYFILLAAIQARFAAHLALFVSVFAAVSIAYIFAAMGFIPRPALLSSESASQALPGGSIVSPGEATKGDNSGVFASVRLEPRRVVYGLVIGVLILSLNLIFTPGLVSQTSYSDAQVNAMSEIEQHAEATNREYPENFVLSRWGDNRMYNYFLSGQAQGYGYARANFVSFAGGSNPDEQYRRYGDRVGYLVITELPVPEDTTHSKLYDDFGAGENATAHYQLVYAGGETRAFALVDGAVITASADPGGELTATTEVEKAGHRFEYSRTATANKTGVISVRVAYPGEYEIGNQTVVVSDAAVHNGTTLSLGGGSPVISERHREEIYAARHTLDSCLSLCETGSATVSRSTGT